MLGNGGAGPSTIFVYDIRSGELVRTYQVEGEDLSQQHVMVNIAFDGAVASMPFTGSSGSCGSRPAAGGKRRTLT